MREASRVETNVVAGEEVVASHANVWQGNGYTGAGVKIGVIDGSFQDYQTKQANGELPSAASNRLILQNFGCANPNTGGGHGTGMAEIVYEQAPGATIYLLCVGTITNVGQAIDFAIANGITIITESLSWYNLERGDDSDGNGSTPSGAGTPSGIARKARQNGILFVESAGNRAKDPLGPAPSMTRTTTASSTSPVATRATASTSITAPGSAPT